MEIIQNTNQQFGFAFEWSELIAVKEIILKGQTERKKKLSKLLNKVQTHPQNDGNLNWESLEKVVVQQADLGDDIIIEIDKLIEYGKRTGKYSGQFIAEGKAWEQNFKEWCDECKVKIKI